MSVSTIHQTIQRAVPMYEQVVSKCYTVAANTVAKINRVALPAIAFFVLSNLPTADAGPLEYAACTTGCALFCTPAATPGCLVACSVLLFLPTP